MCDSSRAGVLRAGAELEERDESHGGMGGAVLEGNIRTLKGTVNTLVIKFTGETQLGRVGVSCTHPQKRKTRNLGELGQCRIQPRETRLRESTAGTAKT